MIATLPAARPARPNFSCGPCAKHPGWQLQNLQDAPLGRSHRAKASKAKLKLVIDLTREVLRVPPDYRIGIVPGSDTGAVEIALWSLLGQRGVDIFAWESFGKGWVCDIVEHLKLKNARAFVADYGEIPNLARADFDNDVVFAWNGTTSGVRVPNADWIAADRKGLTICDATSAAFAQELDWGKLDATTFSWQKALGGEAAHGMLILSPRAVERLETYTPPWPLPKLFRLTHGGKLIEALFEGETINTPSLICVEDFIDALNWGISLGGLDALIARVSANSKALGDWVARTPWVDFLAANSRIRSNTSVCLRSCEVGTWMNRAGSSGNTMRLNGCVWCVRSAKLSSVDVETVTSPCTPPRSSMMMTFSCSTSSSLNALLRESNRCMCRMAARSKTKSRKGR